MLQLTAGSMARGLACYERAIALDPHYANAYARLADYHYYLAFYLNAPPCETLPAGISCCRTRITNRSLLCSIRGACMRCTNMTGLPPGKTSPERWN
jgi:hypothetical protein